MASTVALIDSGLDYKHKDLVSQIWTNPGDSTFDGIDNDHNGYVDDVHGWNFTANDGNIIDYRYANVYNDDIGRFFDLQAKKLLGTATDEETAWLRRKSGDPSFRKKLMTYANYSHGTHVAGIAVHGAPGAKALGIKLIPTENPFASLTAQVREAAYEGKELNWIIKEILKIGLVLVAKAQGQIFNQVGQYLATEHVDVANASLGVGPTQAKNLLTILLTLANGGQAPAKELLDEITTFFLKVVNDEQAAIVKAAPDTLFVFAAGNDGTSNDVYPTAPASIDHPNVISVAAAYPDGRLAPFSNYGRHVSVTAVGINVASTTPNDRHMTMSGTSQAAPYVAGVAARLKDVNGALKAADLKRIIVGTADAPQAAEGRVIGAGMVNTTRAEVAAKLAKEMTLAEAIEGARAQVADAQVAETGFVPEKAELIGPVFMPSPL